MAGADDLYRVQQFGGVTVVLLGPGSLVNRSDLERVFDGLEKMADQSPRLKLSIDMGNVEHISSTCLGKFLALNKKIKAGKGTMSLINVSDPIFEIFALTRVDKQMEIFKSGSRMPSYLTPAWMIAVGVCGLGGLLGIYLLVQLIGGQIGGATSWVVGMYFVLMLIVGVALACLGRVYSQLARATQWSITGVLAGLSTLLLLAWLMSA